MKRGRFFHRFGKDRKGATIVEFALVSLPLVMIIVGLIEIGYREYINVMLQGALDEAARKVTVGGLATSDVQSFVQGKIASIAPQAQTSVQPSSYYNFSGIQTMEPITTDKNGNGQLDPGDCYTDYNNDGTRDTNNGISGLGNSDDIIYYMGTVTFTSVVPIQMMFGWPGQEVVTATAMMRNQPYGSQPSPSTVCI